LGSGTLDDKGLRALYLCYFGLREPLVQTQVLPYLRQLSAGGVEVYLLTFEPEPRRRWSPETVEQWRSPLRSDGINWLWLPYHKRPSLPATMYDIIAGAVTASRLIRRHRIDVLHARTHVAAAMGSLARRISGTANRTRSPRLIFDIRGFVPEEYVDAGIWPAGGVNYRLTKRAERQLLAAADGFVVLTERAREFLFPGCVDTDRLGRPIEVIPCCVDLERFRSADTISRQEIRQQLGVTSRRVVVYVGALGGWYLTEEMAQFLATAHRQDSSTFTIILTQSPTAAIAQRLTTGGVAESDRLIRQVPPEEIPRYLKAADLALSFIKPCYSKLSSSPTKIAEYLASGLPVMCNPGIGDVDEVITRDQVGVIVREFSQEAYLDALRAADVLRQEADVRERCRASARRRYDLQSVGGPRYLRLYHRMLADVEGEPKMAAVAP
jgi:glycosyltransferase involved in cell wall biosynthesis